METLKCTHLTTKTQNLRDLTDNNVLAYNVDVDYCQLFKKIVNKEKDCKNCTLKYCM